MTKETDKPMEEVDAEDLKEAIIDSLFNTDFNVLVSGNVQMPDGTHRLVSMAYRNSWENLAKEWAEAAEKNISPAQVMGKRFQHLMDGVMAEIEKATADIITEALGNTGQNPDKGSMH